MNTSDLPTEVQLQQESAASAKKAEKALDFEDGWGVPPLYGRIWPLNEEQDDSLMDFGVHICLILFGQSVMEIML